MKRKFIRVFLVLLIFLGLPLFVWRMYLAHVISKQLEQIRAAGLPTNGEELNRWYPAVPDNQNAALVLTQAFVLLHTINTDSDKRAQAVWKLKDKFPRRADQLTTAQLELIRWFVETNRLAMTKAEEALKLTSSRYPIDCTRLMNTELPHLAHLANLAALNQCDAALANLAGRNEDATADIVTVLELARTLDGEPFLISQLVRLMLFKRAAATLENRANSSPLNSEEITLLNSAFMKSNVGDSAVLGLIGDRSGTIPYFTISREELARMRPSPEVADREKYSPLPCYGPAILRWIGYYELDYCSYLIGMNKALTVLSNPPPLNLKASGYFARAGEDSKSRQRTLSAQTLSGYANVASRANEAVAQQRITLTALALESFQNEHGKLPEKLEELVPHFLKEVPEDPFTGLDLEYRRTAKGYVIYSVGPDRKDNGGLEKANKEQSADRKAYDITFIVER